MEEGIRSLRWYSSDAKISGAEGPFRTGFWEGPLEGALLLDFEPDFHEHFEGHTKPYDGLFPCKC